MVSQHGRDAPQCTFLSRWPTASRHSATTPHLARHLLDTRIAVQTGRSCGQGQLSKPRQVVTQFPGWHSVSLDGDTKRYLLATHDQRRTRGTRDAAATGASPRHQDRAIAGGAVANPMGPWAIPIAVVLETVGIPILSRPKLLLPSVVSSWHGPDAPLASTVDLVAMQVPNFSDYHKHLPGRNGGEEGIGTNNGHLGDRAQLRLSEEGEGSMVGCPFGAGPTPPFASMHASHRNCQSPLRFASEKYWAATLLGNNELSATGALERAGPSHRVKGTSQDPPADINRHAVIPDLARFHAPGQFFLLFEVQQRKTTWTRNVHWVSNLVDTVPRVS